MSSSVISRAGLVGSGQSHADCSHPVTGPAARPAALRANASRASLAYLRIARRRLQCGAVTRAHRPPQIGIVVPTIALIVALLGQQHGNMSTSPNGSYAPQSCILGRSAGCAAMFGSNGCSAAPAMGPDRHRRPAPAGSTSRSRRRAQRARLPCRAEARPRLSGLRHMTRAPAGRRAGARGLRPRHRAA